MTNTQTTRIIAGALTSLGLAAAGLALGAGTAQALPSQQHQWCPGQSMQTPSGPGAGYVWDMNVCHTWQYVSTEGNVPVWVSSGVDPVTSAVTGYEIQPTSNVWDGPNPPAGSATECGYGLFGLPIRC